MVSVTRAYTIITGAPPYADKALIDRIDAAGDWRGVSDAEKQCSLVAYPEAVIEWLTEVRTPLEIPADVEDAQLKALCRDILEFSERIATGILEYIKSKGGTGAIDEAIARREVRLLEVKNGTSAKSAPAQSFQQPHDPQVRRIAAVLSAAPLIVWQGDSSNDPIGTLTKVISNKV
jgi:hypothetical protein